MPNNYPLLYETSSCVIAPSTFVQSGVYYTLTTGSIVGLSSSLSDLSASYVSLSSSYYPLSSSFNTLSSSYYPLSSSFNTLVSSFVAVSSSLVAVSSSDAGKVNKSGDTMTGQLNQQYGLNFDAVDNPNVPVGSITVTTSSGGSITAGLHYYYVTYYTAIGETKVNQTFPPFSATIVAPNQTVTLGNLPISPDSRVIGRKIYRTTANVNRWQNARLIATIANNTQTTYTDTSADGGSGNAFYRENTTNNLMTMDGARALYVGGDNSATTTLGYNAGSNTFAGTSTGGENVLIGGNANVATGYDASKSVAIGNGALAGESSVSIGHGAQSYSANGACIVIGRNAHTLCGGPGNIAIGNNSMAGGPTNHQANQNVCIGGNSGNKINAGWNNVLIGNNAGNTNVTTNRSVIVIGANCDYPAGGAWAVMNLGNVLYGTGLYYSQFTVSSTPTSDGKIGVCLPSPTARLHLPAGSASAGMAPLKLTAGTNLTTPENGAFEFDGTDLYFTVGGVRKKVSLI